MRPGKTIAAGLIVMGAGVAVERIGDLIFSTTGATAGPLVNYAALMSTARLVLLGVGGAAVVVGVIGGLYAAVHARSGEATSSQSQTPPSSQQDHPRNRQRS